MGSWLLVPLDMCIRANSQDMGGCTVEFHLVCGLSFRFDEQQIKIQFTGSAMNDKGAILTIVDPPKLTVAAVQQGHFKHGGVCHGIDGVREAEIEPENVLAST